MVKYLGWLVAAVAGYKILSDVSDNVYDKLIFGDVRTGKPKFGAVSASIELFMPVKNLTSSDLPFDGLKGKVIYKNRMEIASVAVLDKVIIKANEVTEIPIKVSVYYTTLISLGDTLQKEIKQMIEQRRFEGEFYLIGEAYQGKFKIPVEIRLI